MSPFSAPPCSGIPVVTPVSNNGRVGDTQGQGSAPCICALGQRCVFAALLHLVVLGRGQWCPLSPILNIRVTPFTFLPHTYARAHTPQWVNGAAGARRFVNRERSCRFWEYPCSDRLDVSTTAKVTTFRSLEKCPQERHP